MKRRTFSEAELKAIAREHPMQDGDARVHDLARALRACRKALRPFAKLSTLHADGGYEQHIKRARRLLAPAREGKR